MGGAVFVGTLQLQHDLAGAVTLEPFVGDGRSGDIAAELLEFLALIGAPAHRRMEAKAVRVDTQLRGGRPGCARRILNPQRPRFHFLGLRAALIESVINFLVLRARSSSHLGARRAVRQAQVSSVLRGQHLPHVE